MAGLLLKPILFSVLGCPACGIAPTDVLEETPPAHGKNEDFDAVDGIMTREDLLLYQIQCFGVWRDRDIYPSDGMLKILRADDGFHEPNTFLRHFYRGSLWWQSQTFTGEEWRDTFDETPWPGLPEGWTMPTYDRLAHVGNVPEQPLSVMPRLLDECQSFRIIGRSDPEDEILFMASVIFDPVRGSWLVEQDTYNPEENRYDKALHEFPAKENDARQFPPIDWKRSYTDTSMGLAGFVCFALGLATFTQKFVGSLPLRLLFFAVSCSVSGYMIIDEHGNEEWIEWDPELPVPGYHED